MFHLSSFYTHVIVLEQYVLSTKSTAYQHYLHDEHEVMLLHDVDEMLDLSSQLQCIILFFNIIVRMYHSVILLNLYKKPKLFITIEMIK